MLTQILPPEALPRCDITLTLGNRRTSEMSLSSGPLLTVLQKPETLKQTDLWQCIQSYVGGKHTM